MKIMITDSKGDSISITIGSTGTFEELNKTLDKGEMQLHFHALKNEKTKNKDVLTEATIGLPNSLENECGNKNDNSNLELLEQQVESCLNQIQAEPDAESSATLKISISDDPKLSTESVNDVASSSLCRLCASRGNDMVSMFGENQSYKNIAEKIAECLPIMVTLSDTLPKQVCRSCLNKLELCHNFHKTVAEAERHFLILGGKASLKSDEITEYCEIVNDDENAIGFGSKTQQQSRSQSCYSAPNSPRGSNDSDEQFHLTLDESDDGQLRINKKTRTSSDGENRIVESSSIHDKTSTNRRNKFQCDICGKLFGAQASVNAHQRKHRYVRSFECSVCEKRFYSKDSLEMHKEIHVTSVSSEDNKLSCVYCGETFTQKLPLTVHIMTHTEIQPGNSTEERIDEKRNDNIKKKLDREDRPFKCTVCERTFDHSARLREHSSVHTGKRPYNCSVCNKSFKRANARKVHMVIHTGEKPFKCDLCGTNFRRAGDMRRHRRTQHGQNE